MTAHMVQMFKFDQRSELAAGNYRRARRARRAFAARVERPPFPFRSHATVIIKQ